MRRAVHSMEARPPVTSEISREAWIVLGSVILATILIKSDLVSAFAGYAADYALLVSFIVGWFFTSVVTTTPAIVAIAELSPYIPAWQLALLGAAGAVCGDLLIFRFIRSPLAHYIMQIASSPRMRRAGRAIDRSRVWWIVPALGAVVIASPMPDELGLLMMGASKIRTSHFIILSYVMNAIGIYAIASVAEGLQSVL